MDTTDNTGPLSSSYLYPIFILSLAYLYPIFSLCTTAPQRVNKIRTNYNSSKGGKGSFKVAVKIILRRCSKCPLKSLCD